MLGSVPDMLHVHKVTELFLTCQYVETYLHFFELDNYVTPQNVTLTSQGAAQKVKDYTQREGEKDAEEEANVLQRYSTISAAVMSEINHFHTDRNKDFNVMMRSFLENQISFHKTVCSNYLVILLLSFDILLFLFTIYM